MYLYKLLI